MSNSRHFSENSFNTKSKSGSPKAAPKRTRKGKDILANLMKKQELRKVQPVQKSDSSVAKQPPKIDTQAMGQVQMICVTDKNDGQRLDNFLISALKGVPKSHIYRIVRSGEVRINKKRCKVDSRVVSGDEVRIPPIRLQDKPNTLPVPAMKAGEIPTILFEDQHLLVVDKPAGLACHGGSGIAFGLIEKMRATLGEEQFLELAHRLDRDTSGVIIMAKTRKALVRLHEMMREGEVHKTYLTLVKGDWVNDRQHVKFPLYKYVTADGERRVRVDEKLGLPSHTIFKLIERFGEVSYLEVDLKTGRTHQIRVHAQKSGFPLVGDDKYGDFDFNDEVAKGALGVPFKRMFLHAHRLSFMHPITQEELVIEAPLPKECKTLIEYLESHKHAD